VSQLVVYLGKVDVIIVELHHELFTLIHFKRKLHIACHHVYCFTKEHGVDEGCIQFVVLVKDDGFILEHGGLDFF